MHSLQSILAPSWLALTLLGVGEQENLFPASAYIVPLSYTNVKSLVIGLETAETRAETNTNVVCAVSKVHKQCRCAVFCGTMLLML